MGALAWFFGGMGGLCAVMGIITATKVISWVAGEEFTAMFWMVISAVLLLASVAFAAGRSVSD